MARKFNLAEAAFGHEAVSKLDTEKIRDIPLHQISGNAGNFYALENVEALAGSIQAVGLLDPVVVTPLDVGYKLISGHRRLEAFRLLAKDDPQYETIPARVLPSMDQLRETLALVTANATARELTYPEKLKQEQVLRETLQEMKNAGMEVPRNLGAFMAEQLGTSRNEVSRMHQVNEKLVPEARELVDKGEMTAQKAYDLSRKPEAEQKDAIVGLQKIARADPSEVQPPEEKVSPAIHADLVRPFLREFAQAAAEAGSYSDAQDSLRKRLRNSSTVLESSDFSADNNGVEFDRFTGKRTRRLTWAQVRDGVALACIQQVAKAPEPKPVKTDLWHTEPPEKTGDYVCFYRLPYAAPPKTVSSGILTWDGEWKINGNPVAGVYEVQKWTEVPKC